AGSARPAGPAAGVATAVASGPAAPAAGVSSAAGITAAAAGDRRRALARPGGVVLPRVLAAATRAAAAGLRRPRHLGDLVGLLRRDRVRAREGRERGQARRHR